MMVRRKEGGKIEREKQSAGETEEGRGRVKESAGREEIRRD